MSSVGARPHNGTSATTSTSAVDRSYEWEENYRRRARTMNRDYVNPNSTRLSHQGLQNKAQFPLPQQMARSAANGPFELENSNLSVWGTSSADEDLSQHRAQCLNLFYPTEDEGRARITYEMKHPSQSLKPSISSSRENYEGRGQSWAPSPAAMGTSRASVTHPTSLGMVDPYASVPLPASTQVPSKRHDYEFLKSSLIMFGDDTSFGTGLSEQELLHRKQKEATKARFKAKNNQRNRIVGLPSSLLGRQQRQQQHQSGQQEPDQRTSASPQTVEHEYEPPPPQFGMRRRFPAASRDLNPTVQSSSPDPPVTQAQDAGLASRDEVDPTAGARRMIIPSSSRSRSPSQSPVHDDTETGAFPSPTRAAPSAHYDAQSTRSLDTIAVERTSHSDFRFVANKRPIDPPSRRKEPVIDYEYSLDDSAGWDEQLAVQLMKTVPLAKGASRRRDVGHLDTMHQNEEEWPDPEVLPPLDDSDDVDGDEVYIRNREEAHSDPPVETAFSKQVPHKQRQRQDFASFASPATPATASMTYETSVESASDFDPFQGPDPVTIGEFITPNRTNPKHPQGSFASKPSNPRPGEISRNIDEMLAAVAPSPIPSSYNTRFGYTAASLLNNPPGLNMEEYAPQKPDAPATAYATPRGLADEQHRSPQITLTEFISPNVRWSENLEQKQTPRRTVIQKPTSILRNSRLRDRVAARAGIASLQRQSHARQSAAVSETPVAKGQYMDGNSVDVSFVGDDGRSLSPIASVDGEIEVALSTPATYNASPFERNIPPAFQQAFSGGPVDRFGLVSPSYSDFIEAVACVVIQTSVRRFLSRIRVHKLRLEEAMSRQAKNSHRFVSTHETNGNRNRQAVLNRKPHKPRLNVFALAAIRIQSMFRGWHARDCIAVDHYCATIIQQTFRRHRAESQFAALVYCAITIQAAYRGHRMRQDISVSRQASRNYHPSNRLEADSFRHPSNAIQNLAATIIQSYARSWITRSVLRFWLRSSRTQTEYIFKPKSFLNKSQAKDTYSLPQGYHAHTAFMQQSVHSPVRSIVSPSYHPQEPIYVSSDDEELEVYHKKIDQELEELTKRDQRKGLIKARTNEYFHNGPIANRGEVPPARRTIITVVEKPVNESHYVTNTSFQVPAGVRSYRDLAKAISREETSSPLDTCTTPAQVPSHPPSSAHVESQHKAKPAEGPFRPPELSKPVEIDSSNAALPSSIVSSWNERAAHGNNSTAARELKSGNFQRPLSDASNVKSDVKLEKPAWMVTLEQKKSQSKSVGTAFALKSETAKNGELQAPSDANTTCDWKSRLRKTKSKEDSPVAVLHAEPSTSTSGSGYSRLRGTKSQEEHFVSKKIGQKNSKSHAFVVEGSSKPVELARAANEIEVNDEKKDDYPPELESSNEFDILEPPEKESSVQIQLRPVIQKAVEPSAGTPAEAVTRQHERKNVAPVSPGPLVVPSVNDVARAQLARHPVPAGEAWKSISTVHVEMRKRRSEEEQRRIDAMHHLFLRNGLIGRREKETISFAHTSSAQYQANHDKDVGPAARDLIHAWKGSDQTQPVMTGKLF